MRYAYLVFLSFCHNYTAHSSGPILNVSLVVIGNMAPVGFNSLPFIGPAMSMGTEYVQEKYAGTMQFSLHFLYDKVRNTCPDLGDIAVRMVSEWHYRSRIESDLTVYLNSACIENTEIPYFQSQWNTLWFSTMSATPQVRNRVVNPTWIAVNHFSPAQGAELYMEIFKTYSWTTVFVLVDTSNVTAPIFSILASNLISQIKKQRRVAHIVREISTKQNVPFDFAPILEDISRLYSFLAVRLSYANFWYISITAAGMNMTNGEYVYFALETMRNYKILGKLHWQYDDENDQIALRAFQSLLVVQQRDIYLPPNTKLGAEFVRRSARDYNFTYNLMDQYFPSFADSYMGILSLAAVLNETLVEANYSDFDYGDGSQLARLFLNRTFEYEYGTMYIDSRGERRTNFLVTFFDSSGIRTPFLARLATDQSIREMTLLTTWGNSTSPFPPPNVPFCGYSNKQAACDPRRSITWILATAFTLICVFIVSAILSISYWRFAKKRESEELLLSPWWQIETDDLQPLYFKRSHASFLASTVNQHSQAFSGLSHTDGLVRYALYRNALVVALPLAGQEDELTFKELSGNMELLKILKTCHALEHQNICTFFGLNIDRSDEHACELSIVSAVFASPTRGNLSHLWDSMFSKDFAFASSLILDLLEGLNFIHRSKLGYHGRLSILNCWIDKHFTLKLMHVAGNQIRNELKANGFTMDVRARGVYGAIWEPLFWLAPECKGGIEFSDTASMQAVDIYSAGFILYDILTRGSLYKKLESLKDLMSDDFAMRETPLKTSLDFSKLLEYSSVIKSCLSNDQAARPNVQKLRSSLEKISSAFERSGLKLFDKIYSRVCDYSEQLELEVVARTRSLKEERVRCDTLIRQFIPKELVGPLRAGIFVPPEVFASVTIMFTDLWGFVDFVQTQPPEATLHLVTKTEDLVDTLSTICDVYKIEAVGDSFVVASGLPTRIGNGHVGRIAACAMRTMEAEPELGLQEGLRFKIGFHSGPCAAGVIGVKRPRYCLFGNTINVASRMCSHGAAGRIHVSAEAKSLLEQYTAHEFCFEKRGLIPIKGKGNICTYWLQKKGDTNRGC